MKKLMNIMTGLFFFLVVFTSRAAGEIKVEIHEDQRLVVALNPESMATVLLLQDREGKILFKDSLFTNESYRTSVHLKLLPEGTYFLTIEGDFSIRSWTLEKAEENLKLLEERPGILYKPHFRVSDGRVKVFMSNPGGAKTVLSVYDPEGNVVGLSGDKSTTFRRIIDFSRVPDGLYQVHIKSADRSYLKTIRIEPKWEPERISMLAGNSF